MNIKPIQQRLQQYSIGSDTERMQALREITQEIVLAALGRGEFFKYALFQGGTCMRIFHGLNRFSEDLDFILRKPDPGFVMKDHLVLLTQELAAFGYVPEIIDREKSDATVRKLFIKDESLGKLVILRNTNRSVRLPAIKIKLEIDTNPPAGSGSELKYLDFPFVSAVAVQDLPSLFAGKIHALLCREYVKGRDWYDLIWYTGRSCPINFAFLTAAIDQTGPWQGHGIIVDHSWVVENLKKKIQSLEWKQVADDVRRFVPVFDQPSLNLWSADLFIDRLPRIPRD